MSFSQKTFSFMLYSVCVYLGDYYFKKYGMQLSAKKTGSSVVSCENCFVRNANGDLHSEIYNLTMTTDVLCT